MRVNIRTISGGTLCSLGLAPQAHGIGAWSVPRRAVPPAAMSKTHLCRQSSEPMQRQRAGLRRDQWTQCQAAAYRAAACREERQQKVSVDTAACRIARRSGRPFLQRRLAGGFDRAPCCRRLAIATKGKHAPPTCARAYRQDPACAAGESPTTADKPRALRCTCASTISPMATPA